MIILPAIDLKDGHCVRLYQGDYAQVTNYDADPVQAALRWQAAGAMWLHIVDLDGAARGFPVNIESIKRIREATAMQIEVGGGLRSLADIEQILGLGIERAILGTAAITDRALVQEALNRWGERIIFGLDARDGWIAISGWRETSQIKAVTLAAELCALGARRFFYTDISRDGALVGPNFSALQEMQQAISCPLIASGGISSLADLHALANMGLEGAIVGKAIYSGTIDLTTAIQELDKFIA